MKTNRVLLGCAIACLGAASLPETAQAQDGFMFRNPRVTWNLRLGHTMPAADGEIFQFLTSELTLDRDDFASLTYGGDLNIRFDPKVDIVLGVHVSESEKWSEFRDWVDENDLPIEQVTKLRRVPLTAGIKFYPILRGREIGRYAFVPTKFTPYIGGAAGVMFYRLEQSGDFVDHTTDPPEIFTDFLESSGSAPTVQAFGGADLWILPRLGINVEARYSWASADLNDAFSDFVSIDLRGFQLTSGLSVRF